MISQSGVRPWKNSFQWINISPDLLLFHTLLLLWYSLSLCSNSSTTSSLSNLPSIYVRCRRKISGITIVHQFRTLGSTKLFPLFFTSWVCVVVVNFPLFQTHQKPPLVGPVCRGIFLMHINDILLKNNPNPSIRSNRSSLGPRPNPIFISKLFEQCGRRNTHERSSGRRWRPRRWTGS